MKTAAKYLFDEDFAVGGKPTITMVEHERRRADAESQAYRNGFTAGQEQARAETAERVAGALNVIGDSLERLHRALSDIESRLETEAIEVAVAVGGKLAPELIARQPFVEISALATECFSQLVAVPHVTVHVAPDTYDGAKQALEEIAEARGFAGRLVVQSDAAMTPADCHIEWADGGVVRDLDAIHTTIDEVVARYMAARDSASE